MKWMHYAGAEVLVTSDVAEAVLEYASTLAGCNRFGVLTIPTIAEDGSVTSVRALISSASRIRVEDAEDDELEQPHPTFVRHVRTAAASMTLDC